MVSLIAYIIGAIGSIWYVGFLAYKIEKLPLSIITVLGLALMVYSFYDDWRNDRALADARSESDAALNAALSRHYPFALAKRGNGA